VTPDLRYIPDALADAASLLARVTAEVAWDDRMRARRTASYGVPYNYSGQVYAAAPMPALIAALADTCAGHAGHAFNNCLLNLYETGEHTMGFHHDSYAALAPTSWIAIASLGAPRPLVFRSRDRKTLHQQVLAPGSLLLMNRATQDGWAHALPRCPDTGRRISLTFRWFADAAGA
jgi:alkylated DNA repair dioxygenase AlkB